MLAVDAFRPEWQRWNTFSLSKGAAFLTDGLRSTRPIEFTVRRPYQVSGALSTCEAFDVEGQEIASPECHDNGDETRIKPLEKALRYVLRFGEKR